MTLADILVIVAGTLIAIGNKSADLNTRKLVSGMLHDPAGHFPEPPLPSLHPQWLPKLFSNAYWC